MRPADAGGDVQAHTDLVSQLALRIHGHPGQPGVIDPDNSTNGRKSICGPAMAAGASPRERMAGPAYCANTGIAQADSASTRRKFKEFSSLRLRQSPAASRNSKSDAMFSGVSSWGRFASRLFHRAGAIRAPRLKFSASACAMRSQAWPSP